MTLRPLEEIEEGAKAAPPGPWRKVGADSWRLQGFPQVEYADAPGSYIQVHGDADGAFIAHARTDIPALIAEVRRLRGEVEPPAGFCRGACSFCGTACKEPR